MTPGPGIEPGTHCANTAPRKWVCDKYLTIYDRPSETSIISWGRETAESCSSNLFVSFEHFYPDAARAGLVTISQLQSKFKYGGSNSILTLRLYTKRTATHSVWCLRHQLNNHVKPFFNTTRVKATKLVGRAYCLIGKMIFKWATTHYWTSDFILKTANIACGFLTSHQNSKANLTRDDQKRESWSD